MTNSGKRKQGASFDKVCKFINSKQIKGCYTCKEVHDEFNIGAETLGRIHIALKYAKVLQRVKRGVYQILAHVPDFVTYNMLEANRGYMKDVPNPKYLGKTDKYGKEGCYNEWYVNGERPTISVPRGKKWFANEPNPTTEEKVEKTNGYVAEASGRMSRILAEGKTIEAVTIFDNRPIIILAITDTVGVAKFQYKDTGEISHIALVSIVKGSIKIFEKPSVENKREQIINILKQGLSAADAADKILTLI